MSSVAQDFFQNLGLFKEAILATTVSAFICSWIGIYVVAKRLAFVGVTLPQISGLGIALAFFIGSFLGPHGHLNYFFLTPVIFTFFLTGLAAVGFSFVHDHRRLSNPTLLAIGSVLASALTIIILNSQRLVLEAHEIGDILFGNAVVVMPDAANALNLATMLVGVLLFLFRKKLLTVLFDAESASVMGIKVQNYYILFYLLLALTVSASTRAIGALPVFSFLVLPPAASLMLTRSMKGAILLSIFIAVISALGGFCLSYFFSLPTGPTMAAVCGMFLVPGLLTFKRD